MAVSLNRRETPMPDSKAKRDWDRDNAIVFTMKFMRRTESDMIDYLQQQADKGIKRGTMLKIALREYMNNHN